LTAAEQFGDLRLTETFETLNKPNIITNTCVFWWYKPPARDQPMKRCEKASHPLPLENSK